MKFMLIICILITVDLHLTFGLPCEESCREENCSPPNDCFSGIVKDKCNCCYVCGSLEGQRCFNRTLRGLPRSYQRYPSCGDNLRCELRDDLAEGDQAESICVCKTNEPVCGSDGVTYENLCKLTEERYKRRDGLTTNTRGPCKVAPKIISAPENIHNQTDSNVVFSCESSGFPIPTIEWRFISKQQQSGETDYRPLMLKYLPADDPHVAVQSRGGPNAYEVTSWLQVLRTQVSDTGFYHCVAKNSEGEDSAFGKLTVVERKSTVESSNDIDEIQKKKK